MTQTAPTLAQREQHQAGLLAEWEKLHKKRAEGLTKEETDRLEAIRVEQEENQAAINDDRALRAAERALAAGPTIEPGDDSHKADPWKGASLAEFLMAVRDHELNRGTDARLEVQAAASGANTRVGSEGGFLMRSEWAGEMYRTAMDNTEIITRCRRRPIGPGFEGTDGWYVNRGDRSTGQIAGGIQVYRKAEAALATGSQPKLGRYKLDLEELVGLAYMTNRQMNDGGQMEEIFRREFPKAFRFKLEDEIFNGNGVGQALGIKNSDALITQAKETGQSADTIVRANIDNMLSRLYREPGDQIIWCVSPTANVALPGLTVGDDPVFMPAGGLSGMALATLRTYPVIETEWQAAIGDLYDIMLVNLSHYLIIERDEAPDVQTSIHVKFVERETAFRWVVENNGSPLWDGTVTMADGHTKSPFVTLAARA